MVQIDGPPVRVRTPLAARRRRRPSIRILSVCSVVAVLAVWYALTDLFEVVPELYFPTIGQTLAAGGTLGDTLAVDFGATAYRMLAGWAIGCLSGVLVGLVMARSRIAYFVVNPLIEIIRPVPPIALIPFTILWFGLNDTQRIALACLPCFMVLAVSAMEAARNINPLFVRAAQSLGATPNQVYRTVVLRAILPNLVASLRIAAALAWAVVVSAEYLGAQEGIGYLILQASNSLNTAVVLIGTATVTVGAFLFDQLLRLITTFLTRWVDRMA